MRWLLVPVVAIVAFAGPVRGADAVSYVKDVKPFMEKYCNTCHVGNKPKAGIATDTVANLLKKGVVAGKPASSAVLTTMEGAGKKKMPPRKEKAQPTAAEIAKIKTWIADGAKDDSKLGALPLFREEDWAAVLTERPALVAYLEPACSGR